MQPMLGTGLLSFKTNLIRKLRNYVGLGLSERQAADFYDAWPMT
jgi:hypothetical protein